MGKPPAVPEILAGPGVVGGDDVPTGAAAGDRVQAGQAAGQVGREVVGRILGGDEADVRGLRGKGRELGDGIGPPGDVEVVDAPAIFPYAQPLPEEERVEQSTFQGPDRAAESVDVGVRGECRIGPDGLRADAGEEHSEVQTVRHDRLPRRR